MYGRPTHFKSVQALHRSAAQVITSVIEPEIAAVISDGDYHGGSAPIAGRSDADVGLVPFQPEYT
jgi:hypothetical protein